MKTARDLKSSLELGRTQTVPSRTRVIEAKIRKELENEFGDILDKEEREEIEEKELRRINASDHSLKESRRKILRAKEKAKTVQKLRSGKESIGDNELRGVKVKRKATPSGKKKYNEISFEY
jgi:hypothetical protein